MSEAIKITVDIIIFAVDQQTLKVLLVKRKFPPFENRWAIPGGFVEQNESLEQAAMRELREETSVSDVFLEQLYTFGETNRDPRGRVITVAYYSVIPSVFQPKAGTDASEAKWFSVFQVPSLAFDHARILKYAVERLRNKLEYTTLGFKLLPDKFTLTELQNVFEAILDRQLDKRNFRRKVMLLKLLDPTKDFKREHISRPARLYRFNQRKFEKLRDKGILFPF